MDVTELSMPDVRTGLIGGGSPSRALAPSRTLYPGRPAITAQVNSAPEDIERVADTGLSAVLTLPPGGRADPLDKLRRGLAAFGSVNGDLSHCLVDANRYSGTRRRFAPAGLDPAWVDAQLNAGLAYALTDSPYVRAGDIDGLRDVLMQTKAMKRPVIALLALNNRWLTKDARVLRDEIDRAGVPVALVLEHKSDPLATQAAVRGLVHVLKAEPLVHLLRCDASTIAAVAYGAAGGAIGTKTSLRHLYPMPDPDKPGGFRGSRIAAWVPQLMAYLSLEKIGDLVDHEEVTLYLTCRCVQCNGLTLDHIATEHEAYTHSLLALTDFANHIGQSATPASRRESFQALGEAAQFAHADVEMLGVTSQAPGFIGAWNVAYRDYSSSGQ